VWPVGGKLIFSAFDRNQSVNALVRTLESANQQSPGEPAREEMGDVPKKTWGSNDRFGVQYHQPP
jgi:hypothetical protein